MHNFHDRNVFSICLAIFLLLAGCSSDKNTITIIGEDSATLNAISRLKESYEKSNNVEIKIVALPFEEAMEKSNLDLSQGTGLYDIILQYNFSLSSFVRNDYVYPLDELTKHIPDSMLIFEDDLFRSDWEEVGFYYKDHTDPSLGIQKVGYPFASNSMLLVYNKVMFEDEINRSAFKNKYGRELTPPETWTDLMDIAEFFTRPEKNEYGICLEGAGGGWLYYQWVNMLYGMGGKVMDKQRGWEGDASTQVMLNSQEALKTMILFKSLKPFNKGTFYDIDMYNQKELMKEGNVALSVMWSDILYDLIDFDHLGENIFGFTTVPGGKSINAGGAFFVNKDTENPEEAIKFITWLMEKPNQIKMIQEGLCSPLRSAYSDSRVTNIPYIEALKTSLERGVYMAEAGPDADVISQAITKYVQKVWRGELSAEEGVDAMYKEVVLARKEVFSTLVN